MIYKNIKKIMALSMLWVVISLGSLAGAQQGTPPQQDPPKKNPPAIPVGNKERDKPNNNSGNKGNEPKNNDNSKPKKP